ncbi:HET-domain-containing protein [Sporormia fimetaria CBS 119925]|uniref:HET-domain-containing protein n=1 Tax=Sporormia fimetaria CBS 119925 TaxID=1340428 RepID=A0A6A6UXH2_9PLEO|nr:HET-domain-containing protein [Sporormia fimetaria CBS 119925]
MAVPSPDGDASAPGQLPEDEGYYSRDISRNTSTNSNIPTLSSLKTDELIDGCDSRLDDGQHEVPDPGPAAAGCSQNLNLCSYCVQTILSSTESHGTHHVTIEPARESVKSRCIFCTDLYGDQKNAEWTQYTWAIRSTGRTRNDRPSIAVAFRPAVRAGDSSQPFHRAIKYHVLSEQDMGSIPTEEALGDSTDPRISKGAQLRDWIKTCDDTHPHCYKHRDGAFVPTRLVDLDCEDQGMVRVVETKKHGINTRYCTLSHSWGAAQFLTLTTATESRLTGPGCRIDELTPNFQQAIEVARFIGLRYVWIDSLCIRQGEGGDFKTEGQLMHKVYRFSYCNIAIADSADSEGGLFRDRKPASAILPARYESDGRGKFDAGTWRIVREDLWERELLGTKIYTRGWVFQVERMLSPRILHFAQSQIFWDCAKLSACETLPQGLPNALDTISSTDRHWRGRIQISGQAEHDAPLVGANDDSIETFWKNALLNYTSCNLTNQTDKTMAIWSIAKIARDEFLKELCDAYGQDLGAEYGEEYGGGLWTRALEEQLAWRMKNPGVEGARIPDLQIKNPSWSWASVKGPVLAHDRLCPERMYTVTKHDGESPIEFDVEDYGDNRDEEPTLKTFSLEMMGYKGKAALEETPAQGVFTMALPSANGHEDEDSGTFDVYLDEALAENGGREMDFIILAASATAYIGGFPREMTTEEEEGFFTSSNTDETTGNEPDSNDFYQPDFEGPVTYSGTGLLLTPHSVYAAQQNAVYQALRKELDARDPGFQEKVPWGVKTLKQKTEDMEKVVAMLAKREEEGEGEAKDWYRRVGAITFKGVGRGVWEGLKQGGMRKVWVA